MCLKELYGATNGVFSQIWFVQSELSIQNSCQNEAATMSEPSILDAITPLLDYNRYSHIIKAN